MSRLAISTYLLFFLLCGCNPGWLEPLDTSVDDRRDLLAEQIARTRQAQRDAQSALREAVAVLDDREPALDVLEEVHQAARRLRVEVDRTDELAQVYFTRWEEALERIDDPGARTGSAEQLARTRARHAALMRSLRVVEREFDPVLASLDAQARQLERGQSDSSAPGEGTLLFAVESLISDMDTAIEEGEQFPGPS